jgi:hypothetical protein
VTAHPPACLPVMDAALPARLFMMQNYQPVQDAELPACPGCVIASLSRMRNYQPVQDAELPFCPGCRMNQPVQGAELPACPGCGTVCFVCGLFCLSRLLNFQPVDYAEFLPACLVCGVTSTCLSGKRKYLPPKNATTPAVQDAA